MALPTKQTLSVSSLFSEITAENKLSKLVSITVVSLNVRDLHKTEIKGKKYSNASKQKNLLQYCYKKHIHKKMKMNGKKWRVPAFFSLLSNLTCGVAILYTKNQSKIKAI